VNLFRGAKASTVNISVSASTQRVKITRHEGRLQVCVVNNGTATVWIEFGDVTITAALATGMPVLPGTTRGFTVDAPDGGDVYAAAIAAGSTGSIYFTPGTGI
jgi:hypothetical protein